MIKKIGIVICNSQQEPKVLDYFIDEREIELLVDDLGHELAERGYFIDDVFYKN